MVFQVQQLIVSLVGLRHVHVAGSLHVWYQVCALVRRYVVVHIAQLILYHRQTFVYELRCAYGYLVLILYPVLVVNGYQCVQEILRTLVVHILVSQVYD